MTGSTSTLVGCPLIGKVIRIGADLFPPGIPIPPVCGWPPGPPGIAPAPLVLMRIVPGPVGSGWEVLMEVTLFVPGNVPSDLGAAVEGDFCDIVEP